MGTYLSCRALQLCQLSGHAQRLLLNGRLFGLQLPHVLLRKLHPLLRLRRRHRPCRAFGALAVRVGKIRTSQPLGPASSDGIAL